MLDSLTETLTVKRKTGITKEGDPTYGAAFTMAARIERGRLTQVGQTGELLDDVALVFTNDELLDTDLVWFPEDTTGSVEQAHRPIRVEPQRDLDGAVSHYESSF